MRYSFIFVVFFLNLNFIFSQSDTLQIRLLLEQLNQMIDQKSWDKVLPLAKLGMDATKKIPENKKYTYRFLNAIGDYHLEKGNYNDALDYYEQSRKILLENGQQEGLEIAEVLNKIGNYFREIKDFEMAAGLLEQSLAIRLRHLEPRHIKIADVYNNLGDCFNNLGDFDKALDYYDQSLSIRFEKLTDPHALIAQSYNNIGICFQNKGEFQLALSNFENALKRYIQLFGPEHQLVADVYLNLGNLNTDSEWGDLTLSLRYQQMALRIYQKVYPSNHPLIGLSYNNLANTYIGQGKFQLAHDFYDKALKIREKNYGVVHPDVAETCFNMGASKFLEKAYEPAIPLFEQCLKALNFDQNEKNNFSQVNNHLVLLTLFSLMAQNEMAIFRESELKLHLQKAIEWLRLADQLIDFLRVQYEAIGSKLELSDLAHGVYDDAIRLSLMLFHLDGDEKYKHEAFQYSEKNKGVLLLEGLKKSKAESFSEIPAAVVDALNELEVEIGDLEKLKFLSWEKKTAFSASKVDSISNQIFLKKQEWSNMIQEMEWKYPKYYKLRYETSTVPVAWVQDMLLEEDQSLVSYFLGKDYLFIFLINKAAFEIVEVPLNTSFQRALYLFNQSIKRYLFIASSDLAENVNQYAKAAHLLYNYLIDPVKGWLKKRLVIIPDNELGFVSFDALLSQLPDSLPAFKSYSFLVKDYAISYNYSLGLIKEMEELDSRPYQRNYLGFAPDFLPDNRQGLKKLRYNSREVEGIHKLLKGKMFIGHDATKNNFLKHQKGYKVLHLATHAQANTTSGDFSFLAFFEQDTLSPETSLLFVKEIYSLKTNAEMVVLSACETGIGELYFGEGIASIARSFSYAGAQSLVATNWSVDDKATSELMGLFFNEIERGIPKDIALQSAKLRFMESSHQKFAHPFFWASMIPVGNMSPLEFNRQNPLVFGFAILSILLLAYLVYFWIKVKTLDGKLVPKKIHY